MHQDHGEASEPTNTTGMSRAEMKLRTLLDDADEVDALLATLHVYVDRAGLAVAERIGEVAHEVLSEVVVEALRSVEHFDPDRSARAWLLGIGANVVKRHRARVQRLNSELAFSQLPLQAERDADEWIFNRVAEQRRMDVMTVVDDSDTVQRLLAPLDEDDRTVVQLAILYGMNGVQIAQVLGIRPGAARQRLHRALGRLRMMWKQGAEG